MIYPDYPWMLIFILLAPLPFAVRKIGERWLFGGIYFLPRDKLSLFWDYGVRSCFSLAIVFFPLGGAHFERPAFQQEEIATGSHKVWLLDGSGSMGDYFSASTYIRCHEIRDEGGLHRIVGENCVQKIEMVKKEIKKLVLSRSNDCNELVVFGANALITTPKHQCNPEVFLATLSAQVPNLVSTIMHPAFFIALDLLGQSPSSYTRRIILVSDGEGSVHYRKELVRLFRDLNVYFYWIAIKTDYETDVENAPLQDLLSFFGELGNRAKIFLIKNPQEIVSFSEEMRTWQDFPIKVVVDHPASDWDEEFFRIGAVFLFLGILGMMAEERRKP